MKNDEDFNQTSYQWGGTRMTNGLNFPRFKKDFQIAFSGICFKREDYSRVQLKKKVTLEEI